MFPICPINKALQVICPRCEFLNPPKSTSLAWNEREAAHMLGIGRRKEIEARARSVADLMLLLLGSINSMSLQEFIEANDRRGFVDGVIDLANGHYSFFECEVDKAEFAFTVDYGADDVRTVSAQGFGNYFGLYLNASALGGVEVSVDLNEAHKQTGTLGRDARALQTCLLKFPGFTSMDQIYRRLGV